MGEQSTNLGSLDDAIANLDDMSSSECEYCDDRAHWRKETNYRPSKGVMQVKWYCSECGRLVKKRKIPKGLR